MIRATLLTIALALPNLLAADEIDDMRRALRHDEAVEALAAALDEGDESAAARLAELTLERALVQRAPDATQPAQIVAALTGLDLTAVDQVTLARFAFYHGLVPDGEAALGRARDLDGDLKEATDRVLAAARGEALPEGGYFRYRGLWLPLAERDRERLFDAAVESLWKLDPSLETLGIQPSPSIPNRPAFEERWKGAANNTLQQRAESARLELAPDYETIRSWLPSYDAKVQREPLLRSFERLVEPRAKILALIASYDKPAQGQVDAQRADLESAYDDHLKLVMRDWRRFEKVDPVEAYAMLQRIKDREGALGHVHRYLAAYAGAGLDPAAVTRTPDAATSGARVLPGREHSGLEDVLWLVLALASDQHLDVMARSAELARNNESLTPWERLTLRAVRELSIDAFNRQVATSMDEEERACCEAVDRYRAVLGLQPFDIEERLVVAARGHSQEMVDLDYFGHVSPVDRLRFPSDRARLEGYAGGVGENCFAGGSTGDGAFEAWYRSPGHHRLMVAAGPQIGVGAADGNTWTMLVGGTDLTWRALHRDLPPAKAAAIANAVKDAVARAKKGERVDVKATALNADMADALPMIAREAFAAVNARNERKTRHAPELLEWIVEADVSVAWRALQVAAVATSIHMMEHSSAETSRTASFALVKPLLKSDHGYDPKKSRRKRLSAVQAIRREWEDLAQLSYRPAGLDAEIRDALFAANAADGASRRSALRALSAKERRKLAKKFGGGSETENAVEAGLAWLASVQDEDGAWRAKSFARHIPDAQDLADVLGQGDAEWDVAMTGLALLAFCSAGHTTEQGDYMGPVDAGARFLMEHVADFGRFDTSSSHYMYSHSIGTQALCELYAYSDDPVLRAYAQATLDYLIYAQDDRTGGWRYEPNQAGDTSVTGWAVMALNAGHKGKLDVGGFREALRFLDSVTSGGYYEIRYMAGGEGGTNRLGSIGALCRLFLTGKADDPRARWAGRRMLHQLPSPGSEDYYYWYYGSLVMYQLGGDYWDKWNAMLKPAILDAQATDREPALEGSWPAKGAYADRGGRVMQTALAVLMLTTYYRYDRGPEGALMTMTGDVAKLAAPELEVILGDGDALNRSAAAAKLVDGFGSTLAPVLIGELRAEGTPVPRRKRLASLLTQVARKQHEIVILELLAGESDRDVRTHLGQALARVCSANSVDSLATQLDHAERDVRALAARTLGRLAVPAAVTPLSARLSNETDSGVRTTIEAALSLLANPGQIAALVDDALEASDSSRIAVLDGLSTFTRNELAKELVAEKRHDAELYGSILEAIREHRAESGVPVLLAAMESKRVELRTPASMLLKALTGTTRGYVADSTPGERRKALGEWHDWWEETLARER